MIYLERPLQEKLCAVFHYGLKPHRFLFLGSAETADAAQDLFTTVNRESRLYSARPRAQNALPLLTQRYNLSDHLPNVPAGPMTPDQRHPTALAQHATALENMAPASILVDERHQILHLSRNAGRYILHSEGPFSGKLEYVVRPELRLDLGHALRKAFERKQSSLTMSTAVAFSGESRRIALHVAPANDGEG
jgi:two-component system, chemotaxis family, CheB/CheR fusion protein